MGTTQLSVTAWERSSMPGEKRKEMEDPGHLLSQRRKRGRKPNQVQIQECFFPDCAKKYHPDIISLKNHLIIKHLKKKIENHISKYSKNNNETRDSRECPFKQCGFYAYFR